MTCHCQHREVLLPFATTKNNREPHWLPQVVQKLSVPNTVGRRCEKSSIPLGLHIRPGRKRLTEIRGRGVRCSAMQQARSSLRRDLRAFISDGNRNPAPGTRTRGNLRQTHKCPARKHCCVE